jgi:6-phosphogluconolactonase (cycloisomerase 2 family)
MTTRIQAFFVLFAVSAMTLLTGCSSAYKCTFGFGASSCTSTGPINPGQGGGTAPLVSAYYVATNPNEVSAAELSTTNTLELIPNFADPLLPGTTGAGSAMAIAQSKFVYVTYPSTPGLYAWSISSTTAGLTALNGSPFAASFTAGMPIASVPVYSMITNPTGTLLFVADQLDQQIDVFSIDPSTGLLTAVQGSPFAALVSPSNLATDGLGRFLYVNQGDVNGQGEQMAVFTIDATTGTLSAGTTMPLINMWQVQGDPTGQFMVGADGEVGTKPPLQALDDTLHVFSINQTTGVLTQVSTVVTTNAPTTVQFHPSGKWVYSFGIQTALNFDAPVEGFSFNSTTGTLTKLSGSPFTIFGTDPYDGFLDQSGKYMFVHSSNVFETATVDLTTGIPTIVSIPLQVSSNLGWAVTDPQ